MAAHPFRENVTCGKGSKKKRSQPSIIWPRTHFETLANRNKDGKEKWIKDSKGRNEIKRGNENDFNLIFHTMCVHLYSCFRKENHQSAWYRFVCGKIIIRKIGRLQPLTRVQQLFRDRDVTLTGYVSQEFNLFFAPRSPITRWKQPSNNRIDKDRRAKRPLETHGITIS